MNPTKKLISRSDYLLAEGLEELHRQSQEWLETVAFWKDETRFFDSLLRQRREQVQDQAAYTGMLANLDRLHQMLFEYLAEELLAHEQLLSRIQRAEAGLADADYRDEHRRLAGKMEVFGADFREFKKMVFGYARNW
ncbi:hypothetical protein OZ410_06925 [Robiginitalea sp. M366]|uniref:hypothetical protein n=1 Tax=Robiginitalea aestuariiviva TaxID=3036903 RepID=UPI00240DFAA4|nr:hypothetical protein [Robiginitalea aestuariiviva]MDG1572043.1 hypothetical protein [Robiginitalea aestuariiviva]